MLFSSIREIIFSHWLRDSVSNIWVMNSDGSNRKALTNDDWSNMPAWSPDGSHIAFMSKQDNHMDIFIMDSDGSNRIRLTSNSANDMLPVWSPDGTQIAFLSNRGDKYRWWVMGIDRSEQRLLADIEVYDENISIPTLLLRGTWSRNFLKGTFFAPLITKSEVCVISIDVEKGERGFMTYGDSLNVIEVYGARENDTTFIISTYWSTETNSFDIADLFSGGISIIRGIEQDLASSCMLLQP